MLNNGYMPITNIEHPPKTSAAQRGIIKVLAAVGFVFLVGIGIFLAIYAARFVPTAVKNMGSAVVSLSQVFTPKKPSSLAIVPPQNTLPFTVATDTAAAITTKPTTRTTIRHHKITTPTHAGKRTSGTYQINGTTTQTLYGLPDFTTQIIAAGYMTSTSTDSFVATTTIPHGARVAVKFSIRNDGTNKTGAWTFRASIPTELNYIFNSPVQQSLNPGDHISYILGFNQAKAGSNQTISITANATHSVAESNENNNSASVGVTVLGS